MELNYMERFLNNKINIDKIRESSINVYRRNITIFMNNMELLKDIHEEIELANAITRNDAEDYISNLINNQAESYVNAIISSLKPYFEYLFDDQELITKNPFRKIKQIKNPERVNVKDYFELSEIKRIVKATFTRQHSERNFEINSSRTRSLIYILCNSGARIEEILSLKEDDIHEQDDYYLINYTSNDTKNHVNKQIIIFGDNKKYFDEYLNIKRKLFPESEYVFVSCKGKKLTSKNSEEALQKYCDRCEINKKITNHVFREIFKTVNTNRNINSDLIKIAGGWSLDKISSSYLRSIDIPTLKMVCNIL